MCALDPINEFDLPAILKIALRNGINNYCTVLWFTNTIYFEDHTNFTVATYFYSKL